MAQPRPKSLQVKSADSGKVYHLTFVGDSIYCSCPHFQYRLRKGLTCKHIDQWVKENVSKEVNFV